MAQASEGKKVIAQGRIVWTVGKSLFEGTPKLDFNTRQPKRNAAGEIMMQYGFGMAIPKSVLSQMGPGQPGEIWAALHQEALTLFPSGQIPPTFAMKFKDGDTSVDERGVPYSQRQGYPGHIVLACTTTLPIKFFRYENGAYMQINDGIKCGDYVSVQLGIKAHPAVGQGKAGLYVNPYMVLFTGYGEEIINTPSADAVFGNQAPVVPQGASAVPIAPAGMPPVTAAPVAPSYQASPPAAPAPHYGVLPQVHQPPSGGVPVAAPAAAVSYPGAPQGYPAPAPGAPVATPPPAGMPGVPYPQT